MDLTRLEKKVVERDDVFQLLVEYGSHSWVQVPVQTEHGEEWRTILNNGMTYHPNGGGHVGMASNVDNAIEVMPFIESRVAVYSSVFNIQSMFIIT
ncbi:MAG: hypothetical protein ACI8Q1_000233 [Parvicella sp.]|jgi:hypothetical protein